MSKRAQPRAPIDAQKSLQIEVWPWATHAVATVRLNTRGPHGRDSRRIAVWYLRLTRADLAGHSTDDVIRAILERVLLRLDAGADPADSLPARGPGAPLGATGGTVTLDTLPGL